MHYEEAMRCDVLCTAHTVNAPDERAQGRVGAPMQWSDCIHVPCHSHCGTGDRRDLKGEKRQESDDHAEYVQLRQHQVT